MKTDFKFGITERGDAGLDFSWQNKLNDVIGAVIISKAANVELQNALIRNKNKCIYHATCTGLGGTMLQPNVPSYQEKFTHILRLIEKGFPKNQIIIRIDPILPINIVQSVEKAVLFNYVSTLKQILDFAEKNGIERIRYSYLDLYCHTVQRLRKLPIHFIGNGNLTDYQIRLDKLNENLVYESCCESISPKQHKVGCISKTDLDILGLNYQYMFTYNFTQRSNCLCPKQKFQLLNNNFRCLHKCQYCYWKDQNEFN